MRLCRRIKLWKLILLVLVFVVISLQVFHMSLLNRLETKGTKEFKEINSILLDIESRVRNPQRLDKSGTYNVIPNVAQTSSRQLINSENITIITQCSSNHLHHLVDLTERWTGPVSVSVFTYDKDIEYTIKSVAYYHFCNKRIQRTVSFHIVYPLDRPPQKDESGWASAFDCDTHPLRTNSENYAIEGVEYPHNLLRNLAIKFARTTHIFVIDIDMIPSNNLGMVFQDIRQKYSFLQKSTFISRTAYVIPAFELKEGHVMPSDKQELLSMWGDNLIRPFYSKACWKCQKHTEYNKWKSMSSGDSNSYNIEWKDPWEPFYVATKIMPAYDERFKQYGFNRISQVCELHIAGYQFTVLADVFLVHKGYKEVDKFHRSKEDEQQNNKILFRKFKEELKSKYEASDRRC